MTDNQMDYFILLAEGGNQIGQNQEKFDVYDLLTLRSYQDDVETCRRFIAITGKKSYISQEAEKRWRKNRRLICVLYLETCNSKHLYEGLKRIYGAYASHAKIQFSYQEMVFFIGLSLSDFKDVVKSLEKKLRFEHEKFMRICGIIRSAPHMHEFLTEDQRNVETQENVRVQTISRRERELEEKCSKLEREKEDLSFQVRRLQNFNRNILLQDDYSPRNNFRSDSPPRNNSNRRKRKQENSYQKQEEEGEEGEQVGCAERILRLIGIFIFVFVLLHYFGLKPIQAHHYSW